MEPNVIFQIARDFTLPVAIFIIWFFEYKRFQKMNNMVERYKELVKRYHEDLKSLYEQNERLLSLYADMNEHLTKRQNIILERLAVIQEKTEFSKKFTDEVLRTLQANIETLTEIKNAFTRRRK
jgi:Na+/phosphate symporter